MKKGILLLVLLFVSIQFYAQDFDKLNDIKLVKLEDYKNAEADVLKAANFLFRTPNKPDTQNRVIALSFILKWMEGTDAYTFSIGENAMKATKGSQDLLGMYFAGLTKVALENSTKKLTDDDLHNKVLVVLASYCSKKENKLKPSKVLKKIIKKMKKGS